jgi:hypothetical protein
MWTGERQRGCDAGGGELGGGASPRHSWAHARSKLANPAILRQCDGVLKGGDGIVRGVVKEPRQRGRS